MKKTWKLAASLLLTAVMFLAAAAPARAADPQPITALNRIDIDKHVIVGEHLNNPEATFAFDYEPVTGVEGAGTAAKNMVQMRATSGSKIAVTVPAIQSEKEAVYNNVYLLVNHGNFTAKGIYGLRFFEVVSSSYPAVPGYTYDPQSKYLWLYVDGNPAYDSFSNISVPKYICYAAIVTDTPALPDPDAETGVVAGKIGGSNSEGGVDGIPFTNLYTKKNTEDPEDPESGSLYDVSVTKRLTGNQRDESKSFNFTVIVGASKVSRNILITKGDEVVATISPSNNYRARVSLKKDETFVINGLNAGETYSIEETNAMEYTTTMEGGGTNVERRVYGTIADDHVDIVYTNDRSGTIPTGIFLNYKPYWIMGGIALVLAIFFVRRKKHSAADL